MQNRYYAFIHCNMCPINGFAVGSAEGRDDLRQLQDDDDDAVAAQPQRRTRLQRLRSLLQTPQCKSNYNLITIKLQSNYNEIRC